MSIQIEVIPTSCIGHNLHSFSILKHGKWEEISQNVRERHICQCCNKPFKSSELHAHEVWFFDMETHVQRLVMIASVCEKCHATIHYNFLLSNSKVRSREAFISKAHYMEVNNCEEEDFERDLNKVLAIYRKLNQISEKWSMDISYILKENLAIYEDIEIVNLEKIAPGSELLLKPYVPKIKLPFNNIPNECLIDYADTYYDAVRDTFCEICGNQAERLYRFYDLRVKMKAPEMVLVGSRYICGLCRKTIYHGTKALFFKHRKTTKHYMNVNQCSYEECLQHAHNAKKWIRRNREAVLYIYLKTSYVQKRQFFIRNKYLSDHGAQFDYVRQKWYLRPIRHLKDFLELL